MQVVAQILGCATTGTQCKVAIFPEQIDEKWSGAKGVGRG